MLVCKENLGLISSSFLTVTLSLITFTSNVSPFGVRLRTEGFDDTLGPIP